MSTLFCSTLVVAALATLGAAAPQLQQIQQAISYAQEYGPQAIQYAQQYGPTAIQYAQQYGPELIQNGPQYVQQAQQYAQYLPLIQQIVNSQSG